MLATILFSVFMINSVDIGVTYGPHFPIGRLSNAYKTSSTLSFFTDINRLELNYSYTRFAGQIASNEKLSLHSGTISYQYPFYTTDKRKLNGHIGTGYFRIIRTLNANTEKGYAFGIRYGLKYEQNLVASKLKPTLITLLSTDQIVQTRNWQSMQIYSSAYLLRAMIGMQFNLL